MIPCPDALRLVIDYDYDYVHDARCELDVRDLFTQVAIKPGEKVKAVNLDWEK